MNKNMIQVFSLALWLATTGCDSEKKTSGNSARRPVDRTGSAKVDALPEVFSDNKSVEAIDSYQNVRGSGFVVKNNLQLKAAADACLGPGLGVVTDDMFAPNRCRQGAGGAGGDKLVILGSDKCGARGQNIYDVLKNQLWSPDLAGRTDTLSNQLTPAYLQALAQAADVYAHGVNDPGSLCSTPEKAKEFLGRCIAQFGGQDLTPAAAKISSICAEGGAKAREAVATVLGSAAFAAAAPKDVADAAAVEE